jgi:hypothetical protein
MTLNKNKSYLYTVKGKNNAKQENKTSPIHSHTSSAESMQLKFQTIVQPYNSSRCCFSNPSADKPFNVVTITCSNYKRQVLTPLNFSPNSLTTSYS